MNINPIILMAYGSGGALLNGGWGWLEGGGGL
jgi:hypothetical protein